MFVCILESRIILYRVKTSLVALRSRSKSEVQYVNHHVVLTVIPFDTYPRICSCRQNVAKYRMVLFRFSISRNQQEPMNTKHFVWSGSHAASNLNRILTASRGKCNWAVVRKLCRQCGLIHRVVVDRQGPKTWFMWRSAPGLEAQPRRACKVALGAEPRSQQSLQYGGTFGYHGRQIESEKC